MNARRAPAWAVLLATAATAGGAGADESHNLSCAIAYEQGQRLRNAGRLLAARAQFLVCSDASCPAVLRGDCSRWRAEVDDAVPTVVLSAGDGSGRDLSNVRVELEDKILVTRLDGKPVALDPGAHRFVFVHPNGTRIEKSVTLQPGEDDVPIRASFATPEPAAERSEPASIPTATWVLGGVGLAALAGFAYFALDGRAKKDSLDECSPACNPDDVDAARRSFLIGDVLLAVGVSALAGATIVYATIAPPSSSTAESAASIGVAGHF